MISPHDLEEEEKDYIEAFEEFRGDEF